MLVGTTSFEKIKGKIIQRFAPIDEVASIAGRLRTGIEYELLIFNTNKKLEGGDLTGIYKGKTKRDARLYEREKEGISGLAIYIANALDKQTSRD